MACRFQIHFQWQYVINGHTMKIILAIGIGSFIGGILRYLLSLFIQNKFLSTFPFGTMSVNILGCFLIGLVFGLSERGNISMEVRLFLRPYSRAMRHYVSPAPTLNECTANCTFTGSRSHSKRTGGTLTTN